MCGEQATIEWLRHGISSDTNTWTIERNDQRTRRVTMACDLYCCLLPQCEALRICRSGFPIASPETSRDRAAPPHEFLSAAKAVFPPKENLTLHKFLSAQLCKHTTSTDFQALKGLWNIKTILSFGMLEVRENEMSLRMHALEGSLAVSITDWLLPGFKCCMTSGTRAVLSKDNYFSSVWILTNDCCSFRFAKQCTALCSGTW